MGEDPLHDQEPSVPDLMPLPSRRATLTMLAAWAVSPSALGQPATFPQRPIRLIVPNAPASSVDTIARLVGHRLAALLQQAIVIDNRAGAAGALGTEAGRSAAADGYTLIVASSSSMSVAPLLQKAAHYDPLQDFDFISLLAQLPNALVCNPGLPVHSTAELIAWAKSRGNASNMASAGIGSVSHLAGVALQSAAGFQSLHVPYKGGSQGVASVVSGETDWVLTPAPAAMGLVASGRLRLLAHSMGSSVQPLGDAPAIAQAVPGFEFSSWIGLMAPQGLPPAVADTLQRAVAQALQQADLRKAFEPHGAVATPSTPQAFRDFLARDIELNRKAVRLAGVQPE
jgi:tripartite-type tricarboxylate transporter receptor subunit TctC